MFECGYIQVAKGVGVCANQRVTNRFVVVNPNKLASHSQAISCTNQLITNRFAIVNPDHSPTNPAPH